MIANPHRFVVLAITLLFLAIPSRSLAHRDDYLDETLVYLTLGLDELEPEYWFDYGYLSDENLYFIQHNLALEYGVTERWMIDGRTTFTSVRGRDTRFQSGRFETRYRFADEGTLPIDLAVSGEVNAERREDGSEQYGIEPRLIFSKDFGELNLTVNMAGEIPLNAGEASLNPAFGFRYNATNLIRLGSEIKYSTDDRRGAIVPQVWFTLPHEITIKVGTSIGLDRSRERFGRLAIELEL